MKKAGTIFTLLLVALVLATFTAGFYCGQQHTLDNQIVTNTDRTEGNYLVDLNGKTYYYWYEEQGRQESNEKFTKWVQKRAVYACEVHCAKVCTYGERSTTD